MQFLHLPINIDFTIVWNLFFCPLSRYFEKGSTYVWFCKNYGTRFLVLWSSSIPLDNCIETMDDKLVDTKYSIMLEEPQRPLDSQ